jgi:hypothetical protein
MISRAILIGNHHCLPHRFFAHNSPLSSEIHSFSLKVQQDSFIQNKGYQIDILNPYFMLPNVNSANILATPLLSGPNHSWSQAVTVALRSKH